MENSISRILVGTAVKEAIKSIKDDSDRGIRNLIDMALQLSEGRFQQNFFSAAQTMLQNEHSAYYGLVRDTISNADADRLYTFGMNLGYNGCTVGAQRIRENERNMGCNIPWAFTIQIDGSHFEENLQRYHAVIWEGESLGDYVWMLFAMEHPQKVLSLVAEHEDSAFCIFCKAEDLTEEFLEEAKGLLNTMIVVRYEENAADICTMLKNMGLLYSVWYPYGETDTEAILNGDLFCSAQQFSPLFTVLLAEQGCPGIVQDLAYQVLNQARNEQTYRTMLWALREDNSRIDSIISGDACSVYFDCDGYICEQGNRLESQYNNLFQNSLAEILKSSCPKESR